MAVFKETEYPFEDDWDSATIHEHGENGEVSESSRHSQGAGCTPPPSSGWVAIDGMAVGVEKANRKVHLCWEPTIPMDQLPTALLSFLDDILDEDNQCFAASCPEADFADVLRHLCPYPEIQREVLAEVTRLWQEPEDHIATWGEALQETFRSIGYENVPDPNTDSEGASWAPAPCRHVSGTSPAKMRMERMRL